ncbi:unnamed protein product [Diatraea saccharalis]|uniref:Sushi domain-containing protein n=1 Tax=Diatraea saccharalis TaxID=40085 RepID=A0A9N9N3D8_9NEOP|nr:unnamed protein product [Diatraea saccharalis]
MYINLDPKRIFIAVLLAFNCGRNMGYASATCGFPGAPAHCKVSFSEEEPREGTVVTYSCEPGFELLGPARRVCGPNSRWTPDGIPFCEIASCAVRSAGPGGSGGPITDRPSYGNDTCGG